MACGLSHISGSFWKACPAASPQKFACLGIQMYKDCANNRQPQKGGCRFFPNWCAAILRLPADAPCGTLSTIRSGRRHSRISADFLAPIPAETLSRNSGIFDQAAPGFAAPPALFGGGMSPGTDRCRTAATVLVGTLSDPRYLRTPGKYLLVLYSAFWRCYNDIGTYRCRISAA